MKITTCNCNGTFRKRFEQLNHKGVKVASDVLKDFLNLIIINLIEFRVQLKKNDTIL